MEHILNTKSAMFTASFVIPNTKHDIVSFGPMSCLVFVRGPRIKDRRPVDADQT